ncbi:MAG: cyclopropane-fatty-acyl-phospholipid synthase family protein [Bryobacteraceae bacterium]
MAEPQYKPSPRSLPRAAVLRQLSALARDRVSLRDAQGEVAFGSGGGLAASIEVRDPRFYERCLNEGSLGAAESFLAGEWTCDDLTALFRILVRNESVMDAMESALTRAALSIARAAFALRRNTTSGSSRNIAEHYDLGNDFFRLFLDETLTYSCGIFESTGSSMQEASVAKIDGLCRKMALGPADHLLEIGTGWGAFAIHAARNFGCRVTTATISRQQYEVACERIAEAGLGGRVKVLLEDYRELRGSFDKLVSVEMIEAVGREYLDLYFQVCRDRLKPGGAMALQAILMAEQRYEGYCGRVDFIQKYVFPGSHLPSPGAIAGSARAAGLDISEREDITPHYAETLRRWRAEFWNRIEEVRKLGYSERFIRMWHYYFCYCEAGFEERNTMTEQMLLVRSR